MDALRSLPFGRNLTLDTQALALHGTIAAYASDAEAEPTVPFWDLLFKNAKIRLIGSDDLPDEAERRAVEDIESTLAAGVLRPRVGVRFPLERIADAHEAVEGGRARGRVIVEVSS